jgi:hypothetical protein
MTYEAQGRRIVSKTNDQQEMLTTFIEAQLGGTDGLIERQEARGGRRTGTQRRASYGVWRRNARSAGSGRRGVREHG